MSKHALEAIPLIVADVFELAGIFRRHGETLSQSLGQTQSRWQVLSAASAEPKTVPQIARRLGVSRQNVQRLADRLVEEKLARAAPNPDHKGSPHLILTDQGRATLAEIAGKAQAYHADIARRLGTREIAAAHAALRRFIAALDAVEPQAVEKEER